MKADITIRQAHEQDLLAMQLLLMQLFSIEQDFHSDPQRQDEGLRLLIESPQSGLFVAERSGRVVGMATLQILISTAEGGAVGLVEDVVVDEAERGRGIGRLLLQYLQHWAEQRGLRRLQLLADIDNRPALAFYKGQGWSDTCLVALKKLL